MMTAFTDLARTQAALIVPKLLEFSAAGISPAEIESKLDTYYDALAAGLRLVWNAEDTGVIVRMVAIVINAELKARSGMVVHLDFAFRSDRRKSGGDQEYLDDSLVLFFRAFLGNLAAGLAFEPLGSFPNRWIDL